MLEFESMTVQGALCWTHHNDYLIVPKNLYFDFVMITTESLLEVQRIFYVPSSLTDYSVLIHFDGRPANGYPVEKQYLEIYYNSIWVNHPDVCIQHATLITDATQEIKR